MRDQAFGEGYKKSGRCVKSENCRCYPCIPPAPGGAGSRNRTPRGSAQGAWEHGRCILPAGDQAFLECIWRSRSCQGYSETPGYLPCPAMRSLREICISSEKEISPCPRYYHGSWYVQGRSVRVLQDPAIPEGTCPPAPADYSGEIL